MTEFENFMKNDYWKSIYDNASSKVKEYLKIKWENNDIEDWSDEVIKSIDKIKNEFSVDDWGYLISQSSGRAKYEYTRMMNEKFPETK